MACAFNVAPRRSFLGSYPLQPIPDDELERLAAERGPGSPEANSLAELRRAGQASIGLSAW